ncbi:hypothetical protein CAEBREN_16225 [Caenorhabditis brenneri]|uniref:Protein kinase domain-containing protein n=1 Tax=Caenorhabditis brenneri TaxID=135651 RepID=G0MBB2_CAEBE|nr:hypothetical protein CAEBREN_16225 [Caenorhabditis brenneri]
MHRMRRSTGFAEPVSFHTVMAKRGTGGRSDREVEIQFTNMQLIGTGSFGAVYKAVLRENDEPIAIKKVKVDDRFKSRELTIMHEMDHPNIIRLLYYYTMQQENCLHFVMEFMPKDLAYVHRQYAHNDKQMPASAIKLYMFQLLRGIGFLHLHNIVHRDIKPKNLLVDEANGILKICDFGSAKRLTKNEPNITYICSRYYRAPELIFGSKNYDTSIDTWSVGTVVGELLHNSPIFLADSAIDILALQIKAFGTPSKEDMTKWNYEFVHIPYDTITGVGIQKFIGRKLSLSTLELLNSLLKMDPKLRIRPYAALALPYFDDLRDPQYKLPNGAPIPQLFDWLEKEFIANHEIIKDIFPRSDEGEKAECL